MKLRIDAIAVTSKDFNATVAFYSRLGFEFPPFSQDDQHIEPITQQGAVRLMIDHVDLMRSLNGCDPSPATHSAFALLCDSPSQVNAICANLKEAGYVFKTDPWDAFWGQRYATVIDPDGYEIDLFAPL